MNGCYSLGIHLANIDSETASVFETVIINNARTTQDAQIILANVNNGLFKRWLIEKSNLIPEEDKEELNIFNYKPNKSGYTNLKIFNKWINDYNKYINAGITSTTTHSSDDKLDGFDDVAVKQLALSYTVDLISKKYYTSHAINSAINFNNSNDAGAVLNDVKREIYDNFLSLINTFVAKDKKFDKEGKFREKLDIIESIKREKNNKNAERQRIISEYKTIRKEYDDLLAEINAKETKEQSDIVSLKGKKNEILKKKQDVLKARAELASILEKELDTYGDAIITGFQVLKDSNIKNRQLLNYAALANKVASDSVDWFTQALGVSKALELSKAFDNVIESKKIDESSFETEADYLQALEDAENEALDDSIDVGTDNWSDRLYKNYIKHFNGRLSLYLNTLPVLKSTKKQVNDKGEEDWIYDTDNDLGVATTMEAKEIINNIIEFCSFNTVDEFISSVESLANRIPSMAGLIQLVEDMKKDRKFANFVAVNFGKGRIYKNTITIAENEVTVGQSNEAAFGRSKLYNALLNNGKLTLEAQYDLNDAEIIDSYINYFTKTANIDETNTQHANALLAASEYIVKYLNKMFPNIDTAIFKNYFFGISNDKRRDLLKIFDALKDFNSSIPKVRESIEAERQRVSAVNKAINKAKQEAIENQTVLPKLQTATYDANNINYAGVNAAIGKLVDVLYTLQSPNLDLNSATVTNALASDIIKSSWITTFQRQLNDVVKNESDVDKITYRGAEILKEFYSKTGQGKLNSDNYYSTILWGIKDSNGNYVREGIFQRINDRVTKVNPNVTKLLAISLFNGVRNNDLNTGTSYDEMSRSDYFLSALHLYHKGHSNFERYLDPGVLDDYGNILLRIPSDASNNYMVQMKKYKINDLYDVAEEDVEKFENYKNSTFGVEKYKNKINNLAEAEKETKIVIANKTRAIIDKPEIELNGKNNNINNATAIKLLHDGKIDSLNTSTYKVYYKKDTNKVTIPLIVGKGNERFVIWVNGEGNYRNAKNLEIVSINSLNFIGDLKNKPKANSDLLESVYTKQLAEQRAWFAKPENWEDVTPLLNNFLLKEDTAIKEYAFDDNVISRTYNKQNAIYLSLKHQLFGNLNSFVNALDDIFEETEDGYKLKDNFNHLFDFYHYRDNSFTKVVKDKNGKEHLELSGNVFNFNKLFNIITDSGSINYSAAEELKRILLLYGGDGAIFVERNGSLYLNDNADIKLFERIDTGISSYIKFNQAGIENLIDPIINSWLENYEKYVKETASEYGEVISDNYSQSEVFEAIINQTLAYMEFDDIFEASYDFYKDPQTFLKRDKEVQMGGTPYSGSVDYNDAMGAPVHKLLDSKNQEIHIEMLAPEQGKIVNKTVNISQYNGERQEESPLSARNGWRAVTIFNTKTKYEGAQDIYTSVKERLIKELGNEELASEIAEGIAKPFGYGENGDTTKANDAQSFITLEEWIRRRFADGTLDEYGTLPYKLLSGEQLTAEDYYNARKIQIGKNVYYDIQFDPVTGLHYSRQIKNAEFVLIPSLLDENSDFKKLYDLMHKYDIGQVNTLETSKAANHNVLEFWDKNNAHNENGGVLLHTESFETALNDSNNIETYYYKYLYKQQDFVDHLVDAENKAGIQFVKKLIDNMSTHPNVRTLVDTFQNLFSINIEDSYQDLLIELDWTTDEDGNLVNKKNPDKPLDFTRFWEMARAEAQRLGQDSNFMDYVTPDANGAPKMPNSMNNVSTKLESIAQSIFNSAITRQTLPGFHVIEFTGVGYKYKDVNTGEERELRYRPKVNGERRAVVECALPAWSKEVKDLVKKYGKQKALQILQSKGLDEFIGYRIPTEGKQSIVVFKVVDILDDVEGSKMVVANEWITQTGADNDGDSIYAWIPLIKYNYSENATDDNVISPVKETFDNYELYYNYIRDKINIYNRRFYNAIDKKRQKVLVDRFNKIEKDSKNNAEKSDEKLRDKAINELDKIAKECGFLSYKEFKKLDSDRKQSREVRYNKMFNAAKEMLLNADFADEETLGRSQFDDLSEANANNKAKLGLSKQYRSVYNPFHQYMFMQSAIDGRKLKAFSVNRDTGVSVCNKLHATINSKYYTFDFKYYLSDGYNEILIKKAYPEAEIGEDKNGKFIKVRHDKIGWSKNNRNIVGRLIPSYSSETTAHILDAIKEGAIPNETDYTFGVFKTLVDVGMDYDTAISFLMQPGITALNKDYFRTNGIYSKTFNNPVKNVIKQWAIDHNLKLGDKFIDENSSYDEIYNAIISNTDIQQSLINQFDISVVDQFMFDRVIFSKKLLQNRLTQQRDNVKNFDNDVFDLAVIFAFNNYKSFTNSYENNLKVTRPDSFGAKQTIRATRKIVEDAETYAKGEKDGDKILVNKVVKTEDGKEKLRQIPFIAALYPGIDKKNINIEESEYKSLASFFKYATVASVNANKQVFLTDNDSFYEFTKAFENRIGRPLTDEEAKEFKKYIVSLVYNELQFIVSPVTLNEHNQFVFNNPEIFNNPANYWEKETSRIAGYYEPHSDKFTVEDPLHPTDEELNEFNELTPLQKVMFIKQLYPSDCGIFKFIDTNVKSYSKEKKAKGFSANRLTINIDNKNIEQLFNEFRKCFYNSNKFVKLAAFDLVKYAFVVEGFDFRKGSISKIVPNDILLSDVESGGTNIIKDYLDLIQNKFTKIGNTWGWESDENKELFERFIRSHSEIIKPIRLKKSDNDSAINNLFNNSEVIITYTENGQEKKIRSGMYHIENNGSDASNALIEQLCNINPEAELGYKNISYFDVNGVQQNKLFKIIPETYRDSKTDKLIVKAYNIVPLNKLEKMEHDKFSMNSENNKDYDISFYNKLIQDNLSVGDIDTGYLNQYKIPDYNSPENKVSNNQDVLIEKVDDDSDPIGAAVARDFISKIAYWYDNDLSIFGSDANIGYFQQTSNLVTKIFGSSLGKNGSIIVNIPVKNGTITVELSRNFNKTLRNYHEYKTKGYYYGKWHGVNSKITTEPKLSNYLRKVYNSMQYHGSDIIADGIYQVKQIISVEKNNSINTAASEYLKTNEQASRYEAPDNWTTPSDAKYNNFTEIANLIATELKSEYRRSNEKAAAAISNLSKIGVSFDTMASIDKNKRSIYSVAADYYEELGNEILHNIDNFVVGETYSIDNPELYQALHDNPEYAPKLYNLVLRAKTFGGIIGEQLKRVNVVGEDEETTKAINRIKNIVEKVTSNPKVIDAVNHIYNSYLAYEYSKNPNIKMGIVDLTTAYGDTDFFDTWIGDILNVNNKQIQLIVKLANDELYKARLDAFDAIDEFDDWWESQEKLFGKENLQKTLDTVIDKKGKFIMPYTDEYLEDRNNLYKELNDALDKYGRFSIEYQKAALNLKRFKEKYNEQPISKDYYTRSNDLLEQILNDAPEQYIEYLRIYNEIETKYNDIDDLDETQLEERRNLLTKLFNLRSEFNIDGSSKSDKEVKAARALSNYLGKKKELTNEFFENIENEEYKDNIEKYKQIISDWTEKYSDKTLLQIYEENPDSLFTEAYDWIQNNANYKISDEGWNLLHKQYEKLHNVDDVIRNGISTIISSKDYNKTHDIFGNIIGSKFTEAEQAKIKKITDLSYNPFKGIDANGHLQLNPDCIYFTPGSDSSLIKEVPEGPILTKEFYETFFNKDVPAKDRAKKYQLYSEINKLIIKGFDENGHLSPKKLADSLTDKELENLEAYYEDLHQLNKELKIAGSEEEDETPDGPFKFKSGFVSADVINEINSFKGDKKILLQNIFYSFKKNGKIKKNNKNLIYGNYAIYGYIDLNKDKNGNYTEEAKKWIDQDKTDAAKWLDDNISYETTDYYNQAADEARANGTYDEWFERNHSWNPYKHRWEATKIWKAQKVNPAGELANAYDFVPNSNNIERQVKEDKANKKYNPDGNNYRRGTKYDNEVYNSLTKDEIAFLNKLRDYAMQYTTTYGEKQFIKKGFAPRSYYKEADAKWWADQLASTFGFKARNYSDQQWHETIDFKHDYDVNFNMYSLLKANGYKQPLQLPDRLDFPAGDAGDAAFEAKKKEVQEANKKIAEDNLAIDNSVLDRDWKQVYRKLIQFGYENQAKQRMKDLLYLTIEDLRERESFTETTKFNIFGNLMRSRKLSKEDYNAYEQSKNINSSEIFENWVRRYLFNEFHKATVTRKLANSIQSFISAKFMIGNIRGGIANVATGMVNMLGDAFATTHFNTKQFGAGMAEYMQHIYGITNDFFKNDTTDEVSGIFKLFDVVDTDDYVEVARGDKKADSSVVADKLNSVLYGANGAGEHFMQNSGLLAMLKSHKVYKDEATGKYVIGSLSDYTRMIDLAAFKAVLSNSNEDDKFDRASLLYAFNNQFIPAIKKDEKAKRKYDRLQSNIVRDFINSDYVPRNIRKQLSEEYFSMRNNMYKEDKKKFAEFKDLRSYLVYDAKHHRTKLKDNDEITTRDLAEFKGKVLEVNKIIHGVYDKMGAAMIERTWWGSLVMQYHKHLYPGWMKRWRRKGYFNESIGTNDYGSSSAIIDLFINSGKQAANDNREANKSVWNLILLANNFITEMGISYRTADLWQQQIMRKRLGDIAGMMSALLVTMAIFMMTDDDDRKDSRLIGTMLYLSDRLYTESRQYNVFAAPSEISTLYSSPIAAWSTIQDIKKATEYISSWMFNEDFDWITKSGPNRGKNKMTVLVRRNVPLLRIYDRYQNVAKNNSYYRIGESTNATTLFKNYGLALHPYVSKSSGERIDRTYGQ